MTTTAPQPVSSPTTEAPGQNSPTQNPGSHPGPGRKTLIGLTATLVLAAGIGGYFAVTSTGTASTTPVTTARPITAGGVDVIERSATAQSVTSGGVDVIERSATAQSVTSGGVDVIERSGGKAAQQAAAEVKTAAENPTVSMANMYRGSTVTAESATAASASHWINVTTQTSADTQIAQWTASTRAGLASNDADYGSHWNNDTTGAASASQPVTSGGVDIVERQGCSVQCVAAQFRLEKRTK